MSAILHSITTSIENDRISDQLKNWFNMAVGFRREHKEKSRPVLQLLNMLGEIREMCENWSTARDMDIYMYDKDIEHFGEDFVEEEVAVDYGDFVSWEIYHHYDDERVHAVFRVVTDDDDDEVYEYDGERSYFKVVDYRISNHLQLPSPPTLDLSRD